MASGPNPTQNSPAVGSPVDLAVAGDPDALTGPQVLAELELTRRKAQLLEKRVASLEAAITDLQKAMRQLEAVAPSASPAEEALQEMQHRIGRLERRRAAQLRKPSPAAEVAAAGAPVADLPRVGNLEGITPQAIVNADWSTGEAAVGEMVRLGALLDGFEEGAPLQIIVRSLAVETPAAILKVNCRDSQVTTSWQIPADLEGSELFFEVVGEEQRARSGTLVVLAAE